MAISPSRSDLLAAYADAQGALVRVEERLRLSPVRWPWKARMAFAERQALAAFDAVDFPDDALAVDRRGRVGSTAYDLTHWKAAIGVPISLDAVTHEPAVVLAWLGGDDTLPRDKEDVLAAIARWQAACHALPPSPPLLHAGRIAALWRGHAPLGRGDRVASLLIGDRWGPGRWNGSIGGLTALGLRVGLGAWAIARDTELDRLWLAGIRAGGEAHLAWEVRLRAYAQRAAAFLAMRRRPGRLKEVLLFAMARPAVSSAQVADKLDLTSAGAIKLLAHAVEAGLLLEQTGQASYRRYAIPVSAPSPARPRSRGAAFEAEFWEDLVTDSPLP